MAALKLKTEYIVIGGSLLFLVAWRSMFKVRLINKLASFIPSVEGFDNNPYWDVSRYSWGYGTAAPGSTGTITRDQAFSDMLSYLLSDYESLRKRVTRTLTVNQWAAFLSFSYNLGAGRGGASDLVPYINAGNDTVLANEWRRYNHAGGVINSNLTARRAKEINLWNS